MSIEAKERKLIPDKEFADFKKEVGEPNIADSPEDIAGILISFDRRLKFLEDKYESTHIMQSVKFESHD